MGDKRFEVLDKQGKLTQFQVIRDNQTGVLYMSYTQGSGLAMTVMVDQDGKPLVDEDWTSN